MHKRAQGLKGFQSYLIIVGCDNDGQLVANGVDDGQMEAAVEAYQTANGLTVTGKLNLETAWHMNENRCKLPEDPTLKQVQAMFLLTEDLDTEKLIADGDYGDETKAVMLAFVVDHTRHQDFYPEVDENDFDE